MPVAIKDYFEYHGFMSNPFATTNAEQEAQHLPAFFVHIDWFDWLVGDPRNPQSLILFAPQGYGKTSHRIEVGRLAGERQTAPALVITLNDVGFLLQTEHDQITVNSYLEIIRRKTLEALKPHFVRLIQQRAPDEDDAWLRFAALLHWLVPLYARDVPSDGTSALIKAFQQTPWSPMEWLKGLSALAGHVGFASIYILMDGLDESHLTKNSPTAMLNLLAPLLDAPNLLQECNVAFKFFLPHMLKEHLQQHAIGRLDRIPHRSLVWQDEHLLDMLSRRLMSYSMSETRPMRRVDSFQSLCDVDFDVDLRLVQAAHSSPRVLIDLAQKIVEQHCAYATHVQDLISAATINAVLDTYLEPRMMSAQSTALESEPAEEVPLSPSAVCSPEGVALLFVDAREDVWIGDRHLTKPLPKLLHKCMRYLWQNRYKIVTYEELQSALYGDDLENRGDPRSSSDKLIRRLRAALEPGNPASSTYIEVKPGVGYVLRHFRDAAPDA